MKKCLIWLLTFAMLAITLSTAVFADAEGEDAPESPEAPEPIEVYVTIANSEGKLALAVEKVTVTDIDNDGKLTVNDALFCAHEAKYEGGAAAGYASEKTEYGLSLVKLWGEEHEFGFGYYVNHVSAWSLADELKDGDTVNAFIFRDTENYSDRYCYFRISMYELSEPGKVELTLYALDFDEQYHPVVTPLAGAAITINGKDTMYRTGEDGTVTVQLDEAGEYLISSDSTAEIRVPAACKVSVKAPQPEPPTGDQPADQKTDRTEVYALLVYLGFVVVVAVVDGIISRRRY